MGFKQKRLTPDEIRKVWKGEIGIPDGITVIVAQTELSAPYPNERFEYGAKAIVQGDYDQPLPEYITVLVEGKEAPIKARWKRMLL